MARRKRTRIGSPLTPAILEELNVLGKLPPTPKDFDPAADWTNTYRIWGCHGYRKSGNYNVGFLKIQRIAGKSDQPSTLKIHQQIVHDEAMLNIIDAEVKFANDQLASPIQWQISSSFIDADKNQMPTLATEEKVQLKDNVMLVNIAGKTFKRKLPAPATSDWSLLEVLQRLPFEKKTLSFNMLEGLSVLKQNQQLSYRGTYPLKTAQKEFTLQWFQHLGDGILPYEYFLDENHRLLIAISLDKAYILDDNAQAAMNEHLERQREIYQRELKKAGRSTAAALNIEGGKK